MDTFFTTQEVADRLGVSVFTIRRYIRAGKLPAVQLDGAYRVSRQDIATFLKSREIGHGADAGGSKPEERAAGAAGGASATAGSSNTDAKD